MAKRQRGGTRPGQRAPLQRGSQPSAAPATRPVGAMRPGGLSTDELNRAAELEAQIVAEERAAGVATLGRTRDRRRGSSDPMPATRSREAGTLAVLAEEEYRVVVHDLRRIAIVFAVIFGLLVAAWLLVVALGIFPV